MASAATAKNDLPRLPVRPLWLLPEPYALATDPTDAALQLCAADWLFKQQQFEKAKYRYQVAREWVERELPGREVSNLSPTMPLLNVDPDEPAITWIQAVRRIGSLPPWFQKH